MNRVTVITHFIALFIIGGMISLTAQEVHKGDPRGVKPLHLIPQNIGRYGHRNTTTVEVPIGFIEGKEHNEDLKKNQTPANVVLGGAANGTSAPFAPSTGAGFPTTVQNGWVPYDAAIAVGPNHIVACTNEQIEVYSRAGAFVAKYSTQNSFFPTDAGGSFDPKCYYDAAAGHYVLLFDQASSTQAFMNVAVSQTSDPTGAWWIYHLNWMMDGNTLTSNWGDYPSLGYDANSIYISTNQYGQISGTFTYAKIRVLSKAQLYSGSATTWTDFTNLMNGDGTAAFTVKASRMLSGGNTEYFLNTNPSGGSAVTLWRIDNAPAAPTLTRVSDVAVGAYGVPPSAGQINGWITTNDCRTQDVVGQNGLLYTAFTEMYKTGGKKRNTASSGSGIRYLVISTTAAKVKDISYYVSGQNYYYPAVTVDPTGNMFMVFGGSDNNSYASVYMSGMRTTETAIETAVMVKAGSGQVLSGRWGDYSGIANDFSNPGTAWLFGGYAQANGAWATFTQPLSFAAPAAKTLAQVEAQKTTVASTFGLQANYPNPFNPVTTISYGLESDGFARVSVYNILGQQVATLFEGVQTAGTHQVLFNGVGLASGVYFARLESGGKVNLQRMLLSK